VPADLSFAVGFLLRLFLFGLMKGVEMSKRGIFATVLIVLMLSACSKESSVPKQEGENFFPQGKAGSTWEYLVKMSSPQGNKNGMLIIRIEGEEKINGKEYQKQSSLLSALPDAKPQMSYSRRTPEGIYKLDQSSKDNSEVLLIPFPMKVGTTWTMKKGDGQIVSKAEKIENIEFLGKTYYGCLKITMRGEVNSQPLEGFSYFAPNVGEVTTSLKIGNTSMMYVLNKYSL
jgi:hypothetical protein